MARVNLTIPDDIVAAARDAGLNLSATATAALADAVERRRKALALVDHLAELEREQGPISATDAAAARAWADTAFGVRELGETE